MQNTRLYMYVFVCKTIDYGTINTTEYKLKCQENNYLTFM
jgi:hypothetical protein